MPRLLIGAKFRGDYTLLNYFKIISITFFAIAVILTGFVFAERVGTVEENKPSWYAVISRENKGKKLYVKGDIFSSDKNPAKSLRILDIRKDGLILEDVISKNGVIIKPGDRIPVEGADMIFEKTVESSVLEYNYNKPSKKVTKNQMEDFTIKNLEKNRVALEKNHDNSFQAKELSGREREIFNSPRDEEADKKIIIAELFDRIASKKIGDDVWALDRSSAESAINNTGAALLSAIKRVEPRYRFGEGPSLKFNTGLGTVVVDKEGFLVQSIVGNGRDRPLLTESFGINEGDIIKTINGYPVTSLFGIYRLYEDVALNKAVRLLSINIVRDGKIKTLIYKIR